MSAVVSQDLARVYCSCIIVLKTSFLILSSLRKFPAPQEPCVRLLDVEPCCLDHVSLDHNGEKDEDFSTYWLGYDSERDLSFVSEKKVGSCDRLLRVTLRNQPDNNPGGMVEIDEKNKVGTKLLYRDEFVNIWEFRLAPQERCKVHEHKLRYFFTNLSGSVTKALDENGQEMGDLIPQEVGQTIYVEKDSLATHGVFNVGSTLFLQFIVEFKF